MRHTIILSLLLCCAGAASAATIYCNAQGRECSDRPTATSSIARTVATPPRPADTGAAAGAAVTSAPVDKVQQQRQENEQLAKAQKELKQDFSSKRAEQCKQAKDYYAKAVAATVLYKTDAKGNKQTLSEADANQARLSAKMEMDKVCSQSGG